MAMTSLSYRRTHAGGASALVATVSIAHAGLLFAKASCAHYLILPEIRRGGGFDPRERREVAQDMALLRWLAQMLTWRSTAPQWLRRTNSLVQKLYAAV